MYVHKGALCLPLGSPEMEEEAWGLVGGWAEAQRVRGPGGGVVLKMGHRQMVFSVRKMACLVRTWAPFEPCTAQDGSKTSRKPGFTLHWRALKSVVHIYVQTLLQGAVGFPQLRQQWEVSWGRACSRNPRLTVGQKSGACARCPGTCSEKLPGGGCRPHGPGASQSTEGISAQAPT